ncbi:MAG: hypothetical protein OSJ70_05230 [Bacilli bacterium]|nr:hypothetical protein [Bacilli bacterium]
MSSKIVLYGLTLLVGAFIVPGLNLNNLFKKNHIWEARFLNVTLVIAISYILTNFLYDIVMILLSSF